MKRKHPYRDYDKNPQQTLLEFKTEKIEKPANNIVIESQEEIDNWMEI